MGPWVLINARWYNRVTTGAWRRPAAWGRPREVGGGSGNLKEFLPAVVCTDVRPLPWLDAVADAHALPCAAANFANIVMLDVLHHIVPRLFFAESSRILRPCGRVVMVEPAMTPLARVAYKFFHPEPVAMEADPLAATAGAMHRDPAAGNQAMAHLLFGRHRQRFEREFPSLQVRQCRRFSLFAYRATFASGPLCPARWRRRFSPSRRHSARCSARSWGSAYSSISNGCDVHPGRRGTVSGPRRSHVVAM